jgi:O-antigen biosynthesis protein WbqP
MNWLALRLFDLIFSLMGLLFMAPLMLLIFFKGFFQAGGPIFKQERLGKDQIPFVLIKFRTMIFSTPSVATHLADSTLITPFGKFLRHTKLDELPQLWNVLRGEMSLVGPRPGLANQIELIKARENLGVFTVRPGVTGLSQISGVDMSVPELLAKTDARMIADMSVYSYFRYIFLTIAGKGSGDRIRG